MESLPSLRLAVISDLHVGVARKQGWHNLHTSLQAIDTLGPTVAEINRRQPSLVVVTGDVTSEGTKPQLMEAKGYLDRLDAPYLVCKGNHDQRTAAARADFERVFGGRAAVGVTDGRALGLPSEVALLSLDAWWVAEDGSAQIQRPEVVNPPVRMLIPEEQIAKALDGLSQLHSRLLLVLSHFPLVSQTEYLAEVGGKDAGRLLNGDHLLSALERVTDVVVCLVGHQHFHHVCHGRNWLHLTTGAIAEYPGELRLIDVGPAGIRIDTLCAVDPSLVRSALQESAWVVGRSEDRSVEWKPERR